MDDYQDVAVVAALLNATTGTTYGFLQPHTNRRRVSLMSITGPAGSTLKIYRGYNPSGSGAPVNSVFPADARTYDSTRDGAPMIIWPGEALTFIWSGGSAGTAGAVASATITSEIDL